MQRKRSPLNDNAMNMTFGMGIPVNIADDESLPYPQNRLFPSQFPIFTMPMNCMVLNEPESPEKNGE